MRDRTWSLLKINRWPSLVVFLVAGGVATIFAFVTVNLFSQTMASLEFLGKFGAEAIKHGVLLQLCELVLWGVLSLSCWVLFKICEHELVERYRLWAGK